MASKKKWFLMTNYNEEGGAYIVYDYIENLNIQGYSRSIGYDTKEELIKADEILENCSVCHDPFQSHWCEPTKSEIISKHMCFTCNFWDNQLQREGKIIINGTKYQDGGRSSGGGFIGHGGREFKILMNSGEVIETNNLWCQGRMPERFKKNNPDNAIFLPAAIFNWEIPDSYK